MKKVKAKKIGDKFNVTYTLNKDELKTRKNFLLLRLERCKGAIAHYNKELESIERELEAIDLLNEPDI